MGAIATGSQITCLRVYDAVSFTFHVPTGMRPARHERQILKPIVEPIAVDVMDYMADGDGAVCRLPNDAVFLAGSPLINHNPDIPATDPVALVAAGMPIRAKAAHSFTRPAAGYVGSTRQTPAVLTQACPVALPFTGTIPYSLSICPAPVPCSPSVLFSIHNRSIPHVQFYYKELVAAF